MKKILCTLLFILISINTFSQRVTFAKGYYDSYNNPYVKTTIHNNTYKRIVSLVFTIEYDCSIWNLDHYKEIVIRTNISVGQYKTIEYYPPENSPYKPKRQILSKIIFSDGTYKEF